MKCSSNLAHVQGDLKKLQKIKVYLSKHEENFVVELSNFFLSLYLWDLWQINGKLTTSILPILLTSSIDNFINYL